jgi:hypothetical protein
MSVKDVNRIPELRKKIKKMAASEIRGGVLGNEQLSIIAGANEFGVRIKVTDKMRRFLAWKGLYLKKKTKYIIIPERAAIRSTFDNKKNIKEVFEIAAGIYEIDANLNATLNAMGEKLVSQIQESIKSNFKPKNHPFTVGQKGGKNKTLINTGRYVQGIRYKIK